MTRLTLRISAACLLLASVDAMADASADIRAAMQQMLAARSYHATMHTEGAHPMTAEMDFVAPDRYRMTLPMGTQTIIGNHMTMNVGGRKMSLPLPSNVLAKWRDPANLDRNMAAMSAQALGADMLDGHPAKKYRITSTQPQASQSTLWIGASGYPLQIHVEGKNQATIRYSRFNDPSLRIDASP